MSKHRRRIREAKKRKLPVYENHWSAYWHAINRASFISFADICNQDWGQSQPLAMDDFERTYRLLMGEPI